mmetsp:Transcript_18552/g.38002  ORF Transcript_18552/g.38002 Transcript_18552/m.38002 type:complete len:212 (+) Transcript_18552:130-765(+)|eukprot:CAMPEP_0201135612 /NCGR_PEP_ID=MMETSP0850-20130426/54413_1 /ASSEMBLY_ACC=CAM_ASM_000622 /TAXON_ID=183588 /ORGANISM="Pseudo-nitzschia fraudulenta, Strain WWA7" /LENGTH=211 /DNA_ID=CAMNT_0047406799 /DNA_START=125 /DNA_END=760 /DNA_ORIENTATION=-
MVPVLPSILLVSFLFPSASGFGVGLPMQQQKIQLQDSWSTTQSTTALNILPIDAVASPVEMSDAAHSMWVATIDSDIANIQLEEFRKVFAGGIAVMIGGLISTTLLGTIIEKKDLYANLAAESYIEMADDPSFWKQMTEGMSPEEQEKAKELMAKIKAQREGEQQGQQPQAMASQGIEARSSSTELEEKSSPAPVEADDTAKASNDMFSDY